jgi:photosystem II stability/assembly factor-like uncharacterized protein
MHSHRFLTFVFMLAAWPHAHVTAQTSPWEEMNRGLQHTLVYALAIDPVDSLVMYCGTDFGRLYKSTDGGFNWQLRNNGIPDSYRNERVTALTLDPVNRSILYAGFSGRESVYNLFRSTDAAARWETVDTPGEWKEGGILHIYRVYGFSPVLYAGLGHDHGVYMRPDGTGTWARSLDNAGVQCIAGHPAAPATLYAGTSDGQVLLRTTDYGLHWKEAVQGIARGGKTGVRSLATSPANPARVFAGVTGNGEGLHLSTDAGDSWTRLADIGEISEIAIHPRNENIMYLSAIHSGVFRSTDGGVTWQAVNEGLPTTDVMRVRIAPGYPVRVFAVTLKHGIFRMVDEELEEHLFTYK